MWLLIVHNIIGIGSKELPLILLPLRKNVINLYTHILVTQNNFKITYLATPLDFAKSYFYS